ncbi:MAG: VWA domain-containing protein [Bacteroidetes bacterium]|nr:VWA domain-containing protein [Bacteroidota bacterium]MDA0922366.1 VWA domain-containing protein [Bacteroidota bacterium]MDA1288262.1 VWA domain-containing protein [Bacteroidota bacterium]
MYQIDAYEYIYYLALLPVLWVVYFGVRRWKRKTQARFAQSALLEQLSPFRSQFKPVLKLLMLSLALSLLVLGLMNPKIGTQLETVKREGIDIVFAVDVSKSMLAEDVAPNRIEKSKRLVSAIINQLASDRVGIIAYAAQAIPQLPITTDYGAAKMFLQGLNTDMLSSQGTALDSAIDLAGTFFDDEDQTNRVIFLISDGEDHSEMATDAAQRAATLGIKIFTFGVGTEAGAPIPLKRNGVVESYKKDQEGEVVVTKRNGSILESIAVATGGAYKEGNDTQEVLDFVSEQLKAMDKKEFEAKKFVSYKDRFQPFLFAALLFLIIDLFLFETKTKWVQKLNLFNENNEV